MNDLFSRGGAKGGAEAAYTAKDIEVLEGLEPVRRRPGMYIGGTDEGALHHLVAEILDNAMDEAVGGHATFIELSLGKDDWVTVRDNGRGIPVDPHPKFKDKSALEVILTTLHSGGKFGGKAYATSGGLHGVGASVVNALAETMEIEVARDRTLYTMGFSKGKPTTKLVNKGAVNNRRGTEVRFRPDRTIFKDGHFRPARLFRMARSKAYLFRGVEIRWRCNPSLIGKDDTTPAEAVLHFPGGLADFLGAATEGREQLTPRHFEGETAMEGGGKVEWAVTWLISGEGFLNAYCNTVPTPLGGTHEQGFRAALLKGLRAYGEMVGNRRAAQVTGEDLMGGAAAMLSAFIREPQFQGQTKDKLTTPEAARWVENAIRDRFDHWLTGDPETAANLLAFAISRADERLARREQATTARKTATRKLRLPGKLADCSREERDGSELFIVEGDSAGGSAKQARSRENQAVLPLRGKILNVASASADKLKANQELKDLIEALGCGTGSQFSLERLRYGRIIIMTDADVDGAHIAALLMTFFWRELPELVRRGHVFLARPPLYRLSGAGRTVYAQDDAALEPARKQFKAGTKIEVSRFKGLGEMPPATLRETTMDPKRRTLLRVTTPPEQFARTQDIVEALMGRKPELRFAFIQENAARMDAEAVDV
ncbi:DNA topoisomerase IV subunit B [Elioraea rosea]|uniref:DNA topoisomerase IV subunit B n=1 Tax=Elioraea rosea TaxID=2492390 RepID=UPI0011846277|nr:DNA topoisomerase IV subunit B [Elioraea rosea]